jgi:hypothetical protein
VTICVLFSGFANISWIRKFFVHLQYFAKKTQIREFFFQRLYQFLRVQSSHAVSASNLLAFTPLKLPLRSLFIAQTATQIDTTP